MNNTHKSASFFVVAMATLCLLSILPTYAQQPSKAGIVIVLDAGQLHTVCIDLQPLQADDGEATGWEMLQASGLDIVTGFGGGFVCKIGDTGCPADDCTCEWATTGNYWNYWHGVDGVWEYSQKGASTYVIEHGAVEGWAWGTGESTSLPNMSFEDICDMAESSTTTPTPTTLPILTPTPTTLPTPTPTTLPILTPTPTTLPTLTPTPTTLPTLTPTTLPTLTPTTLPTLTPTPTTLPILTPTPTTVPTLTPTPSPTRSITATITSTPLTPTTPSDSAETYAHWVYLPLINSHNERITR